MADTKARILIVDDQLSAREVLRGLLTGTGYQLIFADNGPEALDKAAKLTPDVILLDVMMPEMTGPELYDELVQLAPEQADAMIFVTGGVFSAHAQEFLDRVKNAQIEKPFDAPALRALVNDRVK